MRKFFIVICFLAIAGCGDGTDHKSQNPESALSPPTPSVNNQSPDDNEPSPKKYDVPDFSLAFLPKAVGKGNFEICLADEAKADGFKSVTLPARLIFQSSGQLTGPLTNPRSYDLNTMSGENKEGSSYAALLENPVTVSLTRPCVITRVKAVRNERFTFSHLNIPIELHLSFQASGLIETDRGYIDNPEFKDKILDFAVNGGVINGTPIKDIDNGETLLDRPD